MGSKGMSAALLAACVMAGAGATADAQESGSVGASDFAPSLFGAGQPGPKPPPKLAEVEPGTDGPGPKPPPKLVGVDPVTNPPGPKPPPR